jgi:hypothetical protein
VAIVAVAVLAIVGLFLLLGGDDDDDDTASDDSSNEQADDNSDSDNDNSDNSDSDNSDDDSTDDTGSDDSGDIGDDGAGRPAEPPTGDAEFDDLADDCYQGDMRSCDELFNLSPVGSDYEEYGDTCGGRWPVSARPNCQTVIPDPLSPDD